MCDESEVTVRPKGESTSITCGPDTLGPDALSLSDVEDPIAKEQDLLASHARIIIADIVQLCEDVRDISKDLSTPGILRDSAPVRFFSLFSQLRDAVKKIDAAIGAEIDTKSMSDDRKHDVGRLQGAVQRYLERIGAKSAPAEGKLVTFTRKVWATATNIAALKAHEVTSVYVKETVNGQTLTSWVNELDKDNQGMPALPDELKDAIKVTEKFSVSARKA